MTRKLAGLVATSLLLGACANEREVVVRVPLSRLELPEPAPRSFGAGIGLGGSARLMLTQDQTVSTPNPDAPELSGDDTLILRLDFQMRPDVGFAVRAASDVAEAQVKWIARAPSPGQLAVAVTAAVGGGKRDFTVSGFGDGVKTKVEQSDVDLALILGYPLENQLMLYGGPYLRHGNYDGTHRARQGSDPDVVTRFEGEADLAGANAGVAWSLGKRGRLLAEYSAAQVRAGDRSEIVGHAAVSAEFFFGETTARQQPGAQEPPVEVVPPERPSMNVVVQQQQREDSTQVHD